MSAYTDKFQPHATSPDDESLVLALPEGEYTMDVNPGDSAETVAAEIEQLLEEVYNAGRESVEVEVNRLLQQRGRTLARMHEVDACLAAAASDLKRLKALIS